MTGEVLLAGDRQLHGARQTGALCLVVWGGLFAGIAIAFVRSGGAQLGTALAPMLIGFAVFFVGLYLALMREEVWFNPLHDRIEVRTGFPGKASHTWYARNLFDRVRLWVEIGNEDARSYRIAFQGEGGAEVPLGKFSDRDEALAAGVRAARRARLAFEEKPEGLLLLRLEAGEVARIPAAELPQEKPWWRRPSALALVIANFVPFWGVLYGGWHILSVMLLFWMENVIVGGYTLLKMLLAQDGAQGAVESIFRTAGNLLAGLFFVFHYGMFCMVHGVFVVFMFGGREAGFQGDPLALPGFVLGLAKQHGLLVAALALVASHGVSFYVHYLKPRVYEDAKAGRIMGEPYARVVILHVVILFGGAAVQATGSGLVPLLMLIGLKTTVDLLAHRRQHAMPHEREMRDFMTEHGHRYLRAKS